LLAIHHTPEQIVKLAKIKLVWRDLDNVSSVPEALIPDLEINGDYLETGNQSWSAPIVYQLRPYYKNPVI